jgi:hypothetical protein
MALPKNETTISTRRTQTIRMATLALAALTAAAVVSGCGLGEVASEGTLHAPAQTGVDGAYAARTASKA